MNLNNKEQRGRKRSDAKKSANMAKFKSVSLFAREYFNFDGSRVKQDYYKSAFASQNIPFGNEIKKERDEKRDEDDWSLDVKRKSISMRKISHTVPDESFYDQFMNTNLKNKGNGQNARKISIKKTREVARNEKSNEMRMERETESEDYYKPDLSDYLYDRRDNIATEGSSNQMPKLLVRIPTAHESSRPVGLLVRFDPHENEDIDLGNKPMRQALQDYLNLIRKRRLHLIDDNDPKYMNLIVKYL